MPNVTKGLKASLMPATPITTAQSIIPGPTVANLDSLEYFVAQAKFVYGSGGTSVDVYIQTSIDGGVTWIDIMNFNFLLASATKVSACLAPIALAPAITPTDGALASNSIITGLLGQKFRAKWKSVGVYAGGTTIQVDVIGSY